jgi:hypothetical protein
LAVSAAVNGEDDRAKRFFAEAGYPNGFEVDLSRAKFGGDLSEEQHIKRRLASFGIDVRILP